MPFSVRFTPEAEARLGALYDYVSEVATPVTAERYAAAVIDRCQSLSKFPAGAPARDDIRPGLRVAHNRGRTIIACTIDEEAQVVWILGIYYGGQDYASFLMSND